MESEMVVLRCYGAMTMMQTIEYESDYRTEMNVLDDIADIIRFFESEDDYVGQRNSSHQLRLLEDELREKFYEYMSEQVDEVRNSDEGKKYFANWVKEKRRSRRNRRILRK
jgi:hypothetical protein